MLALVPVQCNPRGVACPALAACVRLLLVRHGPVLFHRVNIPEGEVFGSSTLSLLHKGHYMLSWEK